MNLHASSSNSPDRDEAICSNCGPEQTTHNHKMEACGEWRSMILEKPDDPIPVRRIFVNPRPRNLSLADILALHNKGGINSSGMSDLVHAALANEIDLPYYTFHSADELSLCIPAGRVLDEAAEGWLDDLMDGLIARKAGLRRLTEKQRTVLAYLMKSEQANRLGRYTLSLIQGTDHSGPVGLLRSSGLIELHSASDGSREVYVVCRELATEDGHAELRALFGSDGTHLDSVGRNTLNMIVLAERFSRAGGLNAKQVTRLLKTRLPEEYRQRGDDEFYRTIRHRMAGLAPEKESIDWESSEWHSAPDKMLAIRGPARLPLFRLNRGYQTSLL